MRFAVILAAGGSGIRFGSDVPKTFISLMGKPLLVWSIPEFQSVDGYSGLVAAVPRSHMIEAENLIAPFGGKVVAGGKRRQDSIREALKVLDEEIDLVAVHDAARPVVSRLDIEKTIQTAWECGGAVLSRPVTDTLKKVEKGRIVGTEDRSKLWRAETPQVFRTKLLKHAFSIWTGEEATDDAQIVSSAGYEVKVVHATEINTKITFPEDLFFLKKMLGALDSR